MADNVLITPGSGNTVAADEVTDATLGTVKVQYVKLMDGTLDGTTKAVVGSNGLKVDGSAVTQPVSGTFFQATQPVSGTVTANAGTGNFTVAQATGSNLHVVVDTVPTTPVTGAFFQATQPVSLTSTTITGTVAVTESGTWTVQPGNTANTTPWLVSQTPASLVISSTAATGVAVTATLPAVAGQFHYVTLIEILKYFTAANAASATPLLVTTTNLPGSLTWSFGQPLGTIGTTAERSTIFNAPLKSSVVNTNTTVVCPATTGIIWRVNVYYYPAA